MQKHQHILMKRHKSKGIKEQQTSHKMKRRLARKARWKNMMVIKLNATSEEAKVLVIQLYKIDKNLNYKVFGCTTNVVDNIERITNEICIVKNKNIIISCVYIQGTRV